MPARNPFKPTAGATPPLLVGRNDVLEEIQESLDDGPGAPARLTILTGARGVGKTALLSEVSDRTRARGWVVLDQTAVPGLIDQLTTRAQKSLRELDGTTSPGRHITGVTLPFGAGGITVSDPQPERIDFRDQLGALLDALERHGTGLLITIDEVHAAARKDMRVLATVFQHLVREGRDVALVMAGLPSAISDLLDDDVLTFLRRATPFVLEDVPLDQVRDALRLTIEAEGRSITDEALDEATRATGGYPFMIQLVGYHVWRLAGGDLIELDAVWAGVPAARKRLGSTVHATAIADLSEVDRTYLVAMSQDEGPASTSEVARRMNVTPHYASTYRGRLIAAGVIEPAGRGYVDFAIPYLRDYLREHAARFEMARRHRKGR